MNWIIFDDEQHDQALAWNEQTIYQVRPRLINNEASDYFGQFAATERVVMGDYAPFWSDKLADHTRLTAPPDDLFLPPEY